MKKLIKGIIFFTIFSIVFRMAFALGVPAILGLFLVAGAAFTSVPVLRLWIKEWWDT